MPETDEPLCKACGQQTRRVVYVLVDGQADAGPYGRVCARRVVEAYAAKNVTATRRYGRA